jgi:Zn-dependent M28 family amino/carboxypeptidase
MRGTCTSYNVVGEWRGTTHPEQIALVGGHLDSWDLGTGAQDDGAGCVQSIQALGLLMRSGYRPNRTHRVVLYANEEFGLNGGRSYAANALSRSEVHVLAIESDGGSGTPRGFSTENAAARDRLEQFKSFLAPYGLLAYSVGGSGADISALRGQGDVVLVGLSADSQRYFDYHHSAQDRIESIHPRELELGAAAMASLLYLFDTHP